MKHFPKPVGRKHAMSFVKIKAQSAVICSGFNSYFFVLAFVKKHNIDNYVDIITYFNI